MAIPKIIHYVWVGKNPKPNNIKMCMKTWSKHTKGYKIIEWNEENFDIGMHPFVKNAYANKKWAFVSDYIRAWAIYTYGGIYLDTDVLLLDNFDKLLDNKAFVGFENNTSPFTAVFGAEKGHPLIKDMLDYYNNLNINFDFKDNNTISVSKILIEKYGCIPNNNEQLLKNEIRVFSDGILCNPSFKSIAIHIFTGTWLKNSNVLLKKINTFIKIRLTNKLFAGLYSTLVNLKRGTKQC